MGRVGHSGLGHSCVLNHVGHGHGGDGCPSLWDTAPCWFGVAWTSSVLAGAVLWRVGPWDPVLSSYLGCQTLAARNHIFKYVS